MSKKFISIEFAHKLLKRGALLLDVRTEEEYCDVHICGAVNVETRLPPLPKRTLNKLHNNLVKTLEPFPYYHPIIVYCKKGIRACHAKKIIKQLGFKSVFNLGGVETEPLKSYMKNPYLRGFKLCKCLVN